MNGRGMRQTAGWSHGVRNNPVPVRNGTAVGSCGGGREQRLNPRKLNVFMDKSLDSEKSVDSVSETAEQEDYASVAKEVLGLLQSQKRRKPIPDGYVCHICYNELGRHFINDCPRKHLGESRTPYQGPNQCYGEFQCERCKRKWKSCKSWANMSERCNKCTSLPNFKNECFPHRQFPLEHAEREGLIYLDRNKIWRVVPQPKDRDHNNLMVYLAPHRPQNPVPPTPAGSTVRRVQVPKRPAVAPTPSQESPFDNMGQWEGPPSFQGQQKSVTTGGQQGSASAAMDFPVGIWSPQY